MARCRTIKPEFFQDEELGELQPLARLLYAGLWCLADREGRLEDRPRRIRTQVMPYESQPLVDEMLAALAASGFIVRYEIAGGRYLSIPSFLRHQRPHCRELPSVIPPPPGATAECLPSPQIERAPLAGPDCKRLRLADSDKDHLRGWYDTRALGDLLPYALQEAELYLGKSTRAAQLYLHGDHVELMKQTFLIERARRRREAIPATGGGKRRQ